MKLFAAALSILLLAITVNADDNVLTTDKEKISYSIGIDIGSGLKKQPVDLDPDLVASGIKDALTGSKPRMTEQEVSETMMKFRKDLLAKQESHMKALGEKNRKEGEAFLEANKKKEGVITLPSGLQYKIIKDSPGNTPQKTDTVTVQYRGTLIDGTEFDSSYRRGKPATFKVNGVIPGWTEALQLMKTGSKWQLFIPPNLAYGERGAGRNIGPNSTLVFEVELLSIGNDAKK